MFNLLLSAALLLAGDGASAGIAGPSGVVVYGSGLVDVRRGAERFGPQTNRIVECSTEQTWCVKGDVIQVAVPKACDQLAVGQRLEVDGVRTQVLNAEDGDLAARIIMGATQPLYLLGSDDRPWVVYAYTRSGVIGLFYTLDRETDLVAVAREHGLAGLNGTGPNEGSAYWGLVTLDAIGACSRSS